MSAFAKNEWRERLLGMFVFRGLLADVHEGAFASARPETPALHPSICGHAERVVLSSQCGEDNC